MMTGRTLGKVRKASTTWYVSVPAFHVKDTIYSRASAI